MGWGTWINAEMYFSRETFNYKDEVEDKIEENRKIIDMIIKKLMIRAAMNPSLMKQKYSECDADEEVPLEDTIYCDISQMMESYDGSLIENYRLSLLLENWDKRQGDYVENPAMDSLMYMDKNDSVHKIIDDNAESDDNKRMVVHKSLETDKVYVTPYDTFFKTFSKMNKDDEDNGNQ